MFALKRRPHCKLKTLLGEAAETPGEGLGQRIGKLLGEFKPECRNYFGMRTGLWPSARVRG